MIYQRYGPNSWQRFVETACCLKREQVRATLSEFARRAAAGEQMDFAVCLAVRAGRLQPMGLYRLPL